MLHTSRTTAFDANNYAGLSYKIMNEVTALMRYSCYGHMHPAGVVVRVKRGGAAGMEHIATPTCIR